MVTLATLSVSFVTLAHGLMPEIAQDVFVCTLVEPQQIQVFTAFPLTSAFLLLLV